MQYFLKFYLVMYSRLNYNFLPTDSQIIHILILRRFFLLYKQRTLYKGG